ncbi:hypothetical protein NIES2135_61700 (plasmid) [Leptolyngbya boryana NIES-2135]|jgi:hypothetical protein|uniref:Uncharacterized protein n=2 Tax=Leptolyngbya TaxID=47251 RepID=A0A1Z4JRK1_LEPBY|nr:hypothetical protein [Leptolyngbya boryana]MBD2372881.1 hypothetical protein [Leptolyngbya sp. FACHB-238]ULP33485.1 hypothetical protein MCP04_30615 [Leptolyngbya boryana IU 594]BAY59293.1 hypothetical protein NIES2135_61700 [Leptolyngbya boryana NIES-2135]
MEAQREELIDLIKNADSALSDVFKPTMLSWLEAGDLSLSALLKKTQHALKQAQELEEFLQEVGKKNPHGIYPTLQESYPDHLTVDGTAAVN